MEDLENVKKYFLKELGTPSYAFRIKRRERSGLARYRIIEALMEAKKPLCDYNLAFLFNRELASVRGHLNILTFNKIICDDLQPTNVDENTRIFYTVCPVCPNIKECPKKLDFWIKSGLLEENKEVEK